MPVNEVNSTDCAIALAQIVSGVVSLSVVAAARPGLQGLSPTRLQPRSRVSCIFQTDKSTHDLCRSCGTISRVHLIDRPTRGSATERDFARRCLLALGVLRFRLPARSMEKISFFQVGLPKRFAHELFFGKGLGLCSEGGRGAEDPRIFQQILYSIPSCGYRWNGLCSH